MDASRSWMAPPGPGRCEACGQPLSQNGHGYWVTSHPNGVHHRCRDWQRVPFPFEGDLERLRRVARAALHAWREVVRDGRWLASVRRGWPADASTLATEWLERKARLELHLDRLRDRIRF